MTKIKSKYFGFVEDVMGARHIAHTCRDLSSVWFSSFVVISSSHKKVQKTTEPPISCPDFENFFFVALLFAIQPKQ